MKIQCGNELDCKAKSCLNCPRHMKFKTLNLTLAEAICIVDFADVDLEQWMKEKPNDVELSQNIMKKLDKRIVWK